MRPPVPPEARCASAVAACLHKPESKQVKASPLAKVRVPFPELTTKLWIYPVFLCRLLPAGGGIPAKEVRQSGIVARLAFSFAIHPCNRAGSDPISVALPDAVVASITARWSLASRP